MKASGIVSVATLAFSASAAPIVGDVLETVTDITSSVPIVGPILSQVDAEALLKTLPLGGDLDDIVSILPVDGVVDQVGNVKNRVTDVDGVVTIISTTVEKVKKSTSMITTVLDKVKTEEIEKSVADAQVIDLVETIQLDITEIVTGLTGAVGIAVAEGDVDRVLVLVDSLVEMLLTTVNSLTAVLGLRPQLASLLHSVFTLVANVLTLLVGTLGGLLPGLVSGLSPLLASLGNGVVAPVVTPVVALVAGIAGI